ncbi:hypothetical protein XH98_28495 [Bradyrhizobium sp. CCBAU 51745]|uniref:hypothetical protein n=1 Tax=Bradyrhizobium sp. CCBAU 51745 TaxID=1325099 RepID=UPI0023066DE2|nr:hypothetical protein [Bradyrhizobium sp. CCBAU 51745]MDA9442965.1 hypothetical protein [Bradyrhizobium sp. CCBAU 51745]
MDDTPEDPFDNKRQQVQLARALIAQQRAVLLHYRLQDSFSKLYADYSETAERLENTLNELSTTRAEFEEFRSATTDEMQRLKIGSDRYRRHLKRLTRWKDWLIALLIIGLIAAIVDKWLPLAEIFRNLAR